MKLSKHKKICGYLQKLQFHFSSLLAFNAIEVLI